MASELSADPRAELAVFTCAIAVHCDRGEHDVATKLERQVVASGIDLRFGWRACVCTPSSSRRPVTRDTGRDETHIGHSWTR